MSEARWRRKSGAGTDNDTPSNAGEHAGWHLIWVFFLIIPLLHDKQPAWLQTGAALLVFLALFFFSFNRTGPLLWLSRGLMFGLGVAALPYNAYAHTFFIYAGMPGVRSSLAESLIIGALSLAAAFTYITAEHLDSTYFAVVSIVVAGTQIGVLWSRVQGSQIALAGKDAEIARLAKIAERDRIARDLHDLLGHTLSMIAIKSELAQKLADKDAQRAAAEMHDVAVAARQALSEVRQTIVGLRSMGLLEALGAVESMLRAAGVELQRQVGQLPPLSAAQESALAQAVLEAGTNIVRHAGAELVSIRIEQVAAELEVRIEDNGRGGDVEAGNGLKGMHERLAAVHARMSLRNLQRGVQLEIHLPLAIPGEA